MRVTSISGSASGKTESRIRARSNESGASFWGTELSCAERYTHRVFLSIENMAKTINFSVSLQLGRVAFVRKFIRDKVDFAATVAPLQNFS